VTFKLAISVLFLAIVPCSGQISPSAEKIDDATLSRIRQAVQVELDLEVKRLQIPGATAGIVVPDGRALASASGVRSLGGDRMEQGDAMYAGSVGKTFVAAVTLQLITEGKISLDQKIKTWLGDAKWFSRLPNSEQITLRMLLNHTSGVPNHLDEKGFFPAAAKGFDRDIRYEELLDFILGKKPLFAAGKGYSYSDTNFILIGLIIEKVTGNTLYNEVATRFTEPLGLSRTLPSNSRSDVKAAGYFENKPVAANPKYRINPQWEWAGGGFTSTGYDLARWAKALYAGSVLPQTMRKEMLEGTTSGEGANYGLGVMKFSGRWGQSLGHDGEFPGFAATMRYYPASGIAVALQINADESANVAAFINSAPDVLAGVVMRELAVDGFSSDQRAALSRTAVAWLKMVHRGELAKSWPHLSAELKAKYTDAQWPSTLKPLISKSGTLKKREPNAIYYLQPNFAAVDFRSSFSKQLTATETLLMKLESDGLWHISSYSISSPN
jgi:D-alanyl-D-alanine carboxypeptidase